MPVLPPLIIPPQITLTAELRPIRNDTPLNGYLRITLCGFGPVLPAVSGAMLADGGIPRLTGPAHTFSETLWGNDVITPANTFYEIAILDENEDVVQAALYQFLQAAGPVTIDLSNAEPITGPYGFSPGNLVYEPCPGAVPGSIFVAPARVLAAAYNGALLPEGEALPVLSYTVGVDQKTITLNFATELGDRVDAFCIL